MTHLYTVLVGGTVIAGRDEPDASAIAWAEATVIAVGSDDDVRAISRGDSHMIDLGGAFVVPLGTGSDPRWPPDAMLEIGGPADLAIVEVDPRRGAASQGRLACVALVRGGRVVAGRLPGDHAATGHTEVHPGDS